VGKPVSGQYEWTYRELDAKRWANFYEVPYYEPRGRVLFDSELLALSCTVAKQFGKVEEYSCLLFAAMFQSSLPKTLDEQECVSCAEECDISAADFHTALRAMKTVKQLDTTIHNAIHTGVFGVPTFVASGELFWGNDRIVLLRHHLYSAL
jgi:2-hydroxychromene-2-carboxylate isomerase